MIRFLLKGIFRDRSRSLFPIITVSLGVAVTIIFYCEFTGYMNGAINSNAKFDTGHVKVVTRAYKQYLNQKPLDLCILEESKLKQQLTREYPGYDWSSRIQFGGLLDIPDENGETKRQTQCMGMSFDLINSDYDIRLLNLEKALTTGAIPSKQDEILLSSELAEKVNIKIGDTVSIMSSTMNSAMAIRNYKVSGLVNFGIQMLDKKAVIVDISAARDLLDMEDASTEILGIRKDMVFDDLQTITISEKFNSELSDPDDEFSAVMIPLRKQNGMGDMIDMARTFSIGMVTVFIIILGIVLWNAGLMNSIRRYGEMGVRLAIGESKKHVYTSMLWEAGIIGLAGSVAGAVIGYLVAWPMQEYGLDFSVYMKQANIIASGRMYALISPEAFFLGIIPGFSSIILGTAIAGLNIFKRQTSQLFKELEN